MLVVDVPLLDMLDAELLFAMYRLALDELDVFTFASPLPGSMHALLPSTGTACEHIPQLVFPLSAATAFPVALMSLMTLIRLHAGLELRMLVG